MNSGRDCAGTSEVSGPQQNCGAGGPLFQTRSRNGLEGKVYRKCDSVKIRSHAISHLSKSPRAVSESRCYIARRDPIVARCTHKKRRSSGPPFSCLPRSVTARGSDLSCADIISSQLTPLADDLVADALPLTQGAHAGTL